MNRTRKIRRKIHPVQILSHTVKTGIKMKVSDHIPTPQITIGKMILKKEVPVITKRTFGLQIKSIKVKLTLEVLVLTVTMKMSLMAVENLKKIQEAKLSSLREHESKYSRNLNRVTDL
jgi:hypothetical protein